MDNTQATPATQEQPQASQVAPEAPQANQEQPHPPVDNPQIEALQSQIQALQETIKALSGEFQAKSQESQAAVESQIKALILQQAKVPEELAPVASGMTSKQLGEWLVSDAYKALVEKLARANEPPKTQHTEPPVGNPPPVGDKPTTPPKASKFSEVTDEAYKRIGALVQ